MRGDTKQKKKKRRTAMNHLQVWNAIDSLAKAKGYSVSGLAKASGLDATTFNKSKRLSLYGQERWPTTYSLSKILNATNTSFSEFAKYMESFDE